MNEHKVTRAKVGVLALARQFGNVSQACRVSGYSRDCFYRARVQGEIDRRLRGIWY